MNGQLNWFTGGPVPAVLDRRAPEVWRQRFGENPALRYVTVFFAGVLVLFGAHDTGHAVGRRHRGCFHAHCLETA